MFTDIFSFFFLSFLLLEPVISLGVNKDISKIATGSQSGDVKLWSTGMTAPMEM